MYFIISRQAKSGSTLSLLDNIIHQGWGTLKSLFNTLILLLPQGDSFSIH